MDRRDVVDQAVQILGAVGLPDLTMRRLGSELGVQQSALYHHFVNKQALLGAVADEILRRGPVTEQSDSADWAQRVRGVCTDLRSAVLAYPDGADVVSSMFAFGLGARAPYDTLVGELEVAGLEPSLVPVAARTLLHFVYGHAVAQQAQEAAAKLGAIATGDLAQPDHDFDAGLAFVIEGVRHTLTR